MQMYASDYEKIDSLSHIKSVMKTRYSTPAIARTPFKRD